MQFPGQANDFASEWQIERKGAEMTDPPVLKVLGLMANESGDGVDTALVEIEETDTAQPVRLVSYKHYPYQARFREALVGAARSDHCQPELISSLSFALGELFAAASLDLLKHCGVDSSDVDLIGSSGYTLRHQPDQMEVGGMWAVSTLQIGEPSVISERTGITVASDFRAADMAAGGQGGPITAFPDYIMFKSANRCRAVQHIGDIGTLTYIPAGGRLDEVKAFDTGPGSTLIDMLVWRLTDGNLDHDAGGAIANAGKPDRSLLSRLMDAPFLGKHPPKTTRFANFGWKLVDNLAESQGVPMEDLVATITAFVAQSIARSYRRWLPKIPDDLVVGGKGARNPALMRRLEESLPGVNVVSFDDFGVDCEADGAVSVAMLANEAVRARHGSIPTATGARHSVVMGKITPGRNFNAILSRLT